MADDPHAISLKDAAELTARWRKEMPPGGFKSAKFNRIAFDKVLSQPGCAGVRIYMGMEVEGAKPYPSRWTFVVVGTDAEGNNILTKGNMMADGDSSDADEGDIEENPKPCPPDCPAPNPLDGDDPPP